MLHCAGQRCPQPVIELARAVRGADAGTRIRIETDDPAAAIDIPAWCRMRGQHCELVEARDGVLTHEITVMRTG